jgi:hypothetical protein
MYKYLYAPDTTRIAEPTKPPYGAVYHVADKSLVFSFRRKPNIGFAHLSSYVGVPSLCFTHVSLWYCSQG